MIEGPARVGLKKVLEFVAVVSHSDLTNIEEKLVGKVGQIPNVFVQRKNKEDVIENILDRAESIHEVLHTQKVSKHVLMRYLRSEGFSVRDDIKKSELQDWCLRKWSPPQFPPLTNENIERLEQERFKNIERLKHERITMEKLFDEVLNTKLEQNMQMSFPVDENELFECLKRLDDEMTEDVKYIVNYYKEKKKALLKAWKNNGHSHDESLSSASSSSEILSKLSSLAPRSPVKAWKTDKSSCDCGLSSSEVSLAPPDPLRAWKTHGSSHSDSFSSTSSSEVLSSKASSLTHRTPVRAWKTERNSCDGDMLSSETLSLASPLSLRAWETDSSYNGGLSSSSSSDVLSSKASSLAPSFPLRARKTDRSSSSASSFDVLSSQTSLSASSAPPRVSKPDWWSLYSDGLSSASSFDILPSETSSSARGSPVHGDLLLEQ